MVNLSNKNRVLKTHNVYFLGRCNGVLYCTLCNFIIGTVNREELIFTKMSFKCKCGSFGFLMEYNKNECQKHLKPNNTLYEKEFAYTCINDKKKLFSISRNILSVFAYKITCVCAATYEDAIKF